MCPTIENQTFDDDVQTFDGDPPDDNDRLHAEEVEQLVWSFNALCTPGAHLAFCLRNAVGAFAGRKTKDHVTIEDAERLKTGRAALLGWKVGRTIYRRPRRTIN